jgi:hypothetical protein
MFVHRAPRPGKFSSTALVQSLAKSLLHYLSTTRTIRRLFADYSSTIRGLFVVFVDYSRTICTTRRLFADYSYYSSTILGLFALFVDYSHYSHHYSSFINCRHVHEDHENIIFLCSKNYEIYNTRQSYCMTVSKNNMWASRSLDRFCVRPYPKLGPEFQVKYHAI